MKLKKIICMLIVLALTAAALPAFAAGQRCPYCGGSLIFRGYARGNVPTCTRGGYATYYCRSCGRLTTVEVPALGHDYRVTSRRAATCTENGYEKKTCSRCGDRVTRTLPASGHDYVCTVTEPTCTEPGARAYTCSLCGDAYSEVIPALGHFYTVAVTEPTCTEEGARVHTCSVCGDSYSEPIPAAGHSYTSAVTEPTCTEEGATVYTCSVCGDSYAEPIPAAGHSYTSAVTEPTCTEPGETVYTCSVCGDSYSEPIPAKGHDCTVAVTEPTCTEEGATVYTCTVCGDSYSDPIPAPGHRFSAWTTLRAPTRFRQGTEQRVCEVCGLAETNPLPKLKGGWVIILLIITVIGGGLFFGLRRHRLVKQAAEAALAVPSVKMKKLLLCLQPTVANQAFEALLKKKVCFTVFTAPAGDPETIAAAVTARRPDLTVISARTAEEAEALLNRIHEADAEQNVTVLGEEGIDPDKLRMLKESKVALSVAMHSDSPAAKTVRLAMVAYRPDVSAGDYIENLTLITDALGLGFVSTLINGYSVKSDIGELIANHGPDGVSNTADSLNDIAGLFGLEAIADLAEKVRVAADQLARNVKPNRPQ